MPQVIQVTGDYIGYPRMGRYLADCSNDAARAHQLYEWNLRAAGAYYEVLNIFEIVLRNAMDREIAAWNDASGHGRDWLINPDPRLAKLLHPPTLSKARSRARQTARAAGRAVTHDDVLSQMTLGTWRYLLPSNSSLGKQRLWTAATSKAFPRWHSNWPPLVSQVEGIHEFRNRVAHLEPLHAQDLRRTRRSVRHIGNAIGYKQGRLIIQSDRTADISAELDRILKP